MAEHTPGPWTIDRPTMGFSQITGPNGELIFGLAAGSASEKQPDEVCDANARLIKAAPDLLEAARHGLRQCELLIDEFYFKPDSMAYRGIMASLDPIRAAIAKAEASRQEGS
jgi:hypothetical protein